MAHSTVCLDACQSLVDDGSTVYIGAITRLEFLQAVRNLANSRSLPQSTRNAFDLNDWEDFEVRRRWLGYWTDQFEQFIHSFDTHYELPYRADIMNQVPIQMADAPMAAYDAFHVCTAVHFSVPELWTTDNGFRKATGIQVQLLHQIVE